MISNPARSDTRVDLGSRVVCLLLMAVTLGVYWQVSSFEFLRWDDTKYVAANSMVTRGLTPDGVVWAFSTVHASNWHPLTWLSHMLDCTLFGPTAAGAHHLVNLGFHLANTVLLLLVLQRATGRFWPAVFVAGLFALHPLHVESVAWVAERKDVLSTFLGLLALGAYVGYARAGGRGRYLLTVALLALGLMAKPMLVSWPLLMLLLDFWPLERLKVGLAAEPMRERRVVDGRKQLQPGAVRSVGFLLGEKLPFAALAAAACVVTVMAQSTGPALVEAEVVPWLPRLANAVVSYVRYLGMMFWPGELGPLYVHPNLSGGTSWSTWQVTGALAVLVAISACVIWRGRRQGYLVTGWLWYVIALAPVIGVVQVGNQALADRYTYVPLIGIFIMVAWGVADFCARWEEHRRVLQATAGVVAVLLLVACAVGTYFQERHWRNSYTLFSRALEVSPTSPTMHFNLGNVLVDAGNPAEARKHYEEALRIRPSYSKAHFNLGFLLKDQGDLEGAWQHYEAAIEADPKYAKGYQHLGSLMLSQRRLPEAEAYFRKLLELEPDAAEAHYYLALAVGRQNRREEAREHFHNALKLKPDWPYALNQMAWMLATGQNPTDDEVQEALKSARRAAKLTNRKDAAILHTLAVACAAAGDWQQAIAHAEEAMQLATAEGNERLARALRARLEVYRRTLSPPPR